MWEDPIVNEVRKIREELEAKFDFDAKSIFKDIRKRQALLGSRLIDRKKKNVAGKVVAPDRDSATPHPGR